MFSEMVNNAAEHGMSNNGAHCHVRLMPHRKGLALDSVIIDRGPGIRATPGEEPRPAGGIRRTGPQARRPGTHLRHRQSHQGHRSLDHLPGMPEARQETPDPLWHRPAYGLRSRFGGILDHPRTSGHHRPVHDPHLTSETQLHEKIAFLNQSQGGMCICRKSGTGLGVSQEGFGP